MPCPRTLEQQVHKILGGFAPKNLSNNHEIHAIVQREFHEEVPTAITHYRAIEL